MSILLVHGDSPLRIRARPQIESPAIGLSTVSIRRVSITAVAPQRSGLIMLLSGIEIEERVEHPVDVVERLACLKDWNFDRDDPDEISISVGGVWADYKVAFTWLPQFEALHLACAFDLKVPERRRAEAANLVAKINEQLSPRAAGTRPASTRSAAGRSTDRTARG